MSLTKEECLEAYEVIDTLIHLMCGETREDGYEPTIDETINSMRILKQLIDKHFEIAKEKECLEKALDKACELIKEAVSQDCTIFDEVTLDNLFWIIEQGELKEWCLKDE